MPITRVCVHAVCVSACVQEIDEAHSCYTFKYVKNKPVFDLCEDQFLKIVQVPTDHAVRCSEPESCSCVCFSEYLSVI